MDSNVETKRARMDAPRVDLYEVYGYPGMTIPYTAPAHIAVCARWSHGLSSRTEGFSVAELGCGDGGNLLPLAFYHPESTFVGIDGSGHALDRAREAANRLGLRNVRYVGRDLRDLASTTFGPFDYIIAHGLYSWVPDDARAAILAFCRDALASDGLTYISYNAQPGWSTRQLVRETLRRSRLVRNAPITEKATKAIELAARLLEDAPSSGFASAVVLADELSRVRNGVPGYVFHEYLEETNDGFWLSDFVNCARQHELAYVVDAQSCRWQGYVPPELRTAVTKRKLDPVEEEETLDLLAHRFFRASILSRADVVRVPPSHHELIENVHIATSLRLQSESLEVTEGTVVHFAGTAGSDITIDSSIGKAAIVLLGANWPLGVWFDQLYQDSAALLVAYDHPVRHDARLQPLDEIEALFEVGQIDLRLREPTYSSEITECPTAHALARWEAERRDSLTTPHHLAVAFDPATLELVRTMDGSRSRSELQDMFGSEFVEQTLPILGRCGLLACPTLERSPDADRRN
jgi:SAM-dependent methyltransferase